VLFAAKDGRFADPRGFEALYPGPGHTSDNIVLRFPRGVVYGGCLIKSLEAKDLGFTGDANLASWPAAIRRVAAQYGANTDGQLTIVPGHGAVDSTGAAFQHTLDLLSGSTKPWTKPSTPP
jgi:metallo-beta-lactamase class B